ncbi:MAG: hypothetical protein KatS3mg110_3638 [Pirellulaceae bacterium]|nr:MAG: hypothetical protein KatS3mg110_3638 [Pirellulaceae bacterium]
MPDKFDPYREALVLETLTEWPDDVELLDEERERYENELHAHPEQCAHLEYIRLHTGFCRKIVVTPADLARLGLA